MLAATRLLRANGRSPAVLAKALMQDVLGMSWPSARYAGTVFIPEGHGRSGRASKRIAEVFDLAAGLFDVKVDRAVLISIKRRQQCDS